MKKRIVTAVGLIGFGFVSISSASPYSNWENEREYEYNGVKIYKADRAELPYQKIADDVYYSRGGDSDYLQMQIAKSYEDGNAEIPFNSEEALNWYYKAAKNKNINAGYKIYEYTRGRGGEIEDIGLKWLKWAAERDQVDAVYQMAINEYQGLDMDKKGLISVRRQLERAEELGHKRAGLEAETITRELERREFENDWGKKALDAFQFAQ